MEPRIQQPVLAIPGALDAMLAFNAAAHGHGVPEQTIALVQLRASQVNGCHVCIGGHCSILRKGGETGERVDAVANWRRSQEFTPAERAALALTDEVTHLADRPDAVPDEIWEEAARHFDEPALSALLIGIAATTVFNLLNVATRQPAGTWQPD